MAKGRVDPDELERFLAEGRSQADAAKHFGVTEAAISQRVKTLRIATSKVVALERAGEVVEQKMQATERLERVQQVIDDELHTGPSSAPKSPTRTAEPSRTPFSSWPPRSGSSSACSSTSRGR